MKLTIREMILAALFAALTMVGAFIKIPIGVVPITLQFLFTALAGIMLGGRVGAISQLVYVVVGLIGFPVFAGGVGGPGIIVKPSFGYLMGFVLAAYVIGKLAEGINKPRFINLFAVVSVGLVVMYIVGLPYFYVILNYVMGSKMSFYNTLNKGMLIFLPGDLLKCLLVALLGTRVIPAIKKAVI